jgi:putative SOS response-associated peptidase YedK
MPRPGVLLLEFTGTKSPKSKRRFTKVEPWFCFAGLWRPMQDGAAFTLLTTDPSSDVAPIHDRQMVILERSDWSTWLEQTGNEGDLLRALPAESLNVEQVP